MVPLNWAQCVKTKLIKISLVLIYLSKFSIATTNIIQNVTWDVSFGSWYPYMAKYHPYMRMDHSQIFALQFVHLNKTELIESNATIQAVSDSQVLGIRSEISLEDINDEGGLNVSFVAFAIFFGRANVFVEITRPNNDKIEQSPNKMTMKIVRIRPLKLKLETFYELYETSFYTISTLLCGMVIDWKEIAAILRKPIAPGISMICNFVFVPLVSRFLKSKLKKKKSEIKKKK